MLRGSLRRSFVGPHRLTADEPIEVGEKNTRAGRCKQTQRAGASPNCNCIRRRRRSARFGTGVVPALIVVALEQLAGFVVHEHVEDCEEEARIRQAGKTCVIGNEQALRLIVEGDVCRIRQRQRIMGGVRRVLLSFSFPSLEIVANKRRATIKDVKNSHGGEEELDAGANRSKRRPGLRLGPGKHKQLRHIFDHIEKTGDDYRPHEDAAHPATARPVRRIEGIRRQRASDSETDDINYDEHEIEREIESHGPFVRVAPLVQNL